MRTAAILIAGGLVGLLIFTTSANSASLLWLESYQTYSFNTASGDLEPNQYAIDGEQYVYRQSDDRTSSQFKSAPINPKGKEETIDVSRMIEVRISGQGYYDEFLDVDGQRLRVQSDRQKYEDLGKPGATPREKIVYGIGINKAYAAIVFDASSTSQCTACNSLTYAQVVGVGSNTVLTVGLTTNTTNTVDTLSAVTYNGAYLATSSNLSSGGKSMLGQMYKVAPSTGSNNVVITTVGVGGADNMIAVAGSYFGVDQASPIEATSTATGTSVTPSVAITAASDTSMVVDMACGGSDFTAVGAGQTQRVRNNVSNATPCNNGAYSEQLGSVASDVMSWTISASDSWIISATALRAAADVTTYVSTPSVIIQSQTLLDGQVLTN